MNDSTQLYRHFNKDGALLYVGISLSALQRLSQHGNGSEWFDHIAHVTIENFPNRIAAERAEKKAIQTERPTHNIAHALKAVNEETVSGLIWGASAIGKYLGRSEKGAFHVLESGKIPGARKIGGRWCLDLRTFMAVFEE